MKLRILVMVMGVVCLSGCTTYRYRVVQPAVGAQPVTSQPLIVRSEPLEYLLVRQGSRLAIRVTNPTESQIVLLGDRSYVIDPLGESHAIRGRVLGPHSYASLLLPPVPLTYAYPDYNLSWGMGGSYGWGFPGSFWGPYYGYAYYGPPAVYYQQYATPYDWTWKTGPARLRLVYSRDNKTFEHDFEIIREPEK